MNEKTGDAEHQKLPRKQYATPRLVHFGAIKDLTSGGTGGPEMGMVNMMMMMLMRRA
jgi:hypothetical protein